MLCIAILLLFALSIYSKTPKLPTLNRNFGKYELIHAFTATKKNIVASRMALECLPKGIDNLMDIIALETQNSILSDNYKYRESNRVLELERTIAKSKTLMNMYYKFRHLCKNCFCKMFSSTIIEIMIPVIDYYNKLAIEKSILETTDGKGLGDDDDTREQPIVNNIILWNSQMIIDQCEIIVSNNNRYINGDDDDDNDNYKDITNSNVVIKCMKEVSTNATFEAAILKSKLTEISMS